MSSILNRHRFLGVIDVRDMLVGEKIDDRMVDAVEKTLLHLDARQRADKALCHRSQIVPDVRGVRRVIGVGDDLSVAGDQQAVLLVDADKVYEICEGG
jgi:hypothetical protein